MLNQTDSIIGCLLGTAVGDALGLPCEGLSKHRQRQIYPNITRHHFFFNKGMVSDDTEHTCLVAQSLIISGDNEQLFRREWAFVKASTRITHTDPKAEFGALAVAIAAYLASCHSIVSPQAYYQTLQEVLGMEATEFLELIKKACDSAAKGQTSESFAMTLGCSQGVSGYVYCTVPMVIHVWLRHQRDYPGAIAEIIRLGGDTDTTAAILGGIIGGSHLLSLKLLPYSD